MVFSQLNASPEDLAAMVGVSRATIYRWHTDHGPATSRQLYTICDRLRLRPATFVYGVNGGGHILSVPDGRPGGSADQMGEWVRGRIMRCRATNWAPMTDLAHASNLDRRTVKRCIESDDVRWSDLMRFIEEGLRVNSYALLDPDRNVPTI
jgi:hypothetical protein